VPPQDGGMSMEKNSKSERNSILMIRIVNNRGILLLSHGKRLSL